MPAIAARTSRPRASRRTSPATPPPPPLVDEDRSYYSEGRGLDEYLAQLKRFPPLTRAEEHELAVRKEAGDTEARELLINHNLRFGVFKAKEFYKKTAGALPMADFISIANEAIIHAVDLFSASAGTKFTTYAYWWIQQRTFTALGGQARTLTVPQHAQTDVRKLSRAAQDYQTENWKEATDEILALKTGIALDKVKRYRPFLSNGVSLSKPLSSGNDRGSRRTEDTLSVTEADLRTDPNVDEHLESAEVSEIIRKALVDLPSELAVVVKMLYGLDGYPQRSFVEMGYALDNGRETARQKYYKAESLLKASPHMKRLKQLFRPNRSTDNTLDVMDDENGDTEAWAERAVY